MSLLPSFTALGTSWHIELFTETADTTKQVIHDDLLSYIKDFEAAYTRFSDSSILSQLNRTGYLTDPDARTVHLLKTAQELYRETMGRFNVLIHDHLTARGYDAQYSFTERPAPEQLASPETALSVSASRITTAAALDLGGFGKGYLIDLVAERLSNLHQVPEFLINGGGDMFGTTDHGQPITVYLQHPIDRTRVIGTTTLSHQGFAASSPHTRRWKTQTGETHHIIDPHGTTTVRDASFVLAPSATRADAYATALLVMDPHQIDALATNPGIGLAFFDASTSRISLRNNFPFQAASPTM